MKKILIVAEFINEPEELGNSRFTTLARALNHSGFEVEIVTSSFNHISKSQKVTEIHENAYKLTRIFEEGYPKNICLKRFRSHAAFARRVRKFLNKSNAPNLIFCAVPSFDVGVVSGAYAKKHHIPFVIDIQDLWPEAFKMVFCPPLISGLIYAPFTQKENKVFKLATKVVAVSQTYVTRATSINPKCGEGLSVFLGTDLATFDEYRHGVEKDEQVFTIVYIGTLGHSYNLKCIIDAMALLNQKGMKNLVFKVLGDGPKKVEFEKHAVQKQVNCHFLGYLPYEQMVKELCSCDVAVNCIADNAAQSIINKVGDYAAGGLPVISTQQNQEYKNLLVQYNAGFSCKNSDIEDLAQKLELLYCEESLRATMGAGNRRLAEELFDRAKTYKKIVTMIKELTHEI